MGLLIVGKKTNKRISWSHSTLHDTVRLLALKYCGCPEYLDNDKTINAFNFYMDKNGKYEGRKYKKGNELIEYDIKLMDVFLHSVQLSGLYFPNIMLHCDSEGMYWQSGRCDPINDNTLMCGNSYRLLKELELIINNSDFIESKDIKIIYAYEHTKDFYNLVKDEIENGSGTIVFS